MKKAVLFIAEGFEEVEALTVVDVLRRASITCDMCSIKGKMVKGAHGIEVKTNILIEDLKKDEYEALVLPGGMPGAANLKGDERVIALVQEFNEKKKLVAAICAAPIVLAKADIIKDRKITSYPGYESQLKNCNYIEELVAQDGNIITSRGPATALYFAYKIVEILMGKAVESDLRKEMLMNLLENK